MTTHGNDSSTSVDESCIFCKIATGQIPCARVYEDKHVIAFLDLNPAAKGHTLVLPKKHYPTLLDLPVSEGEPLVSALRIVGEAVMAQTGAGGFNCLQNNFAPAGQMVFHTHWHIIPRFENDNLPDWPSGSYSSQVEMQELAAAIAARIA